MKNLNDLIAMRTSVSFASRRLALEFGLRLDKRVEER